MSDLSKMSEAELGRRIEACCGMICEMCSERRPPAMSIPADPERDKDLLITDTLHEARRRLTAAAVRVERLMFQHANQRTTLENYEAALRRAGMDPCDFSKAIDKLAADRDAARAEVERLSGERSTLRIGIKTAIRFLESDDANAKRDAVTFLTAALSPAPAVEAPNLLWAFNCRAERIDDGHYRVTLTGSQSGTVRTRTGYHPMWELIRLLAEDPAPTPAPGGAE